MYKGNKVEHFIVKPIKKTIDDRVDKKCTICNILYPNTKDYFHLDTYKLKLGFATTLDSKCIECRKKYKKEQYEKKYLKLKEKGKTLYSTWTESKKENTIKRNKEYAVKNRDKINQRCRDRVNKKTPGILNSYQKKRIKNKKESDEITNYYLCRLMTRNHKDISTKELLQYPEYLDLYRANLKLKRACKALETSMN